jgi:hypothetical protein
MHSNDKVFLWGGCGGSKWTQKAGLQVGVYSAELLVLRPGTGPVFHFSRTRNAGTWQYPRVRGDRVSRVFLPDKFISKTRRRTVVTRPAGAACHDNEQDQLSYWHFVAGLCQTRPLGFCDSSICYSCAYCPLGPMHRPALRARSGPFPMEQARNVSSMVPAKPLKSDEKELKNWFGPNLFVRAKERSLQIHFETLTV